MTRRESGRGTGRPPEREGTNRAASLFSAAFTRHQAGDLVQAEALYRRVLAVAPGHPETLHFLGLIRAQSGDAEAAVGLIEQAIVRKPGFALAHYNLGNALRRLGRLEAAVDAYGRALRLEPDTPDVLLNLGVTLRDLGRADEAVETYQRALARQPDYVEAHYNLGVALQGLDRQEEAVRAYRQAVSLRPDHADAHANLVAALLALGRPSEAVAACRRRLDLEPRGEEAHTTLASALLELGEAEEAVAVSRRAAALFPAAPAPLLRLGDGLRELGRGAEAAAAYERAVSLDPRSVHGWIALGVGRQELGRLAEAADAVERALAIDPASAPAWSVRGGLKTFAAGDPDVETLERLLAATGPAALKPPARIDVEFTLGKAFMDIGDADAAFDHLDVGNRLKRASLDYDVDQDIEAMTAMARVMDAARLVRWGGGGAPSAQPLFVIGMPRSGTTLVEQILASHPAVHGAGELPMLEAILIERLGPSLSPLDRARRLADLSSTDIAAMGAAYAAGVAALAPGAARVTDKMPSNFRLAGLISAMLPNARIIHCRRDPVDTCLSCYAHNFTRGQPFAYDLRELGRYHLAYQGLMDHWRAVLRTDRFTEVAYEEVVADLEGEARRLVGFCGLEWDDACLNFHQTRRPVRTASVTQVRQPLYRTSVARWKRYERRLAPLLEVLSSPLSAEP